MDTVSILRTDYKKYSDYLYDYRYYCSYFGYKVRIDGGWKFFNFYRDYKIWKMRKIGQGKPLTN